jgi:HPt (histidine-containing phosphotransfer) domain-containing protein
MINNKDKAIDFSYLIEMVGDDPAFLIEFFETFTEHAPIYLAEMENALANQNWNEVANCAHKIKPTFSYIGRNDVKELVRVIEDNARDQTAGEKIKSDVEKLKLLCADIFQQLEVEKIKLISQL